MTIVKCSEIEGTMIATPHRRLIKILSSPETVERRTVGLTFGMSIIPPKEQTESHSHDGTEECIYVVSGTGFSKVGEEQGPLESDTLVLVRPGEPHEFHNTSDEIMKLIWAYCPPGAEKSLLSKSSSAIRS